MNNLSISRHAETRMSQRGIRQSDLDILIQFGEQISDDAFMITQKAAKTLIHKIERLVNTKFIIEGDMLVTAYKPKKAQQNKDFKRLRG